MQHKASAPIASARATAAAPVQLSQLDDPFGFHLGHVQRHGGGAADPAAVQSAAAAGVDGSANALPYAAAIQASFGSGFDVSSISAHVGGRATDACADMGASAYATGSHVAFASAPDLHTAAHEAAHVVQQQRGVSLYGGVGVAGDVYEQHADAIADRVVAGQSAADLLAAGPGAAPAVQRKDAPESSEVDGDGATGSESESESEGEDEVERDTVGDGVVPKKVKANNAKLVSDPANAGTTLVATLNKGAKVKITDLGESQAFNDAVRGTKNVWWKVNVLTGASAGTDGWMQEKNLGTLLKVKKKGKKGYKGKVGGGNVEIRTGQKLERDGADDGDNNFALTYKGKDADKTKWLQFIWREIIGVDATGTTSTPVTSSITTTGGTYDLTDNGTFTTAGVPAKNNYNTDSPDTTNPFYESVGESERTRDSSKMIDLPGAAATQVKSAFSAGASKVVSRAHFNTYLVKERDIVFGTKIDVNWQFNNVVEADAPPPGKHAVSGSGATAALPATIKERFDDQFPAFTDIG